MKNINPVKARRDKNGHIFVDGFEKVEIVSCLNSDWDDSNNIVDFHKHLCAAFDRENLDEWAVFAVFHTAIVYHDYVYGEDQLKEYYL